MKVARVLIMFASIAPLSCGGGSGGTAGTGGTAGNGSGVALSAFSAKYAQALCAQNFKCVPAADLSGHTMQDCVATNQCALDFEASSIGDAQARSRATYDPVQMAACIVAISEISCADWDKGFAVTTQPAVCANAVVSKVAQGGACLDDVECTTRFCHGIDPTTEGTCSDASSLGMTCASSADCASGFYCDLDKTMCAAQKQAGAACTLEAECLTSCDSAQQCSSYAGCVVSDTGRDHGGVCALIAAAAILLARRRSRASARTDWRVRSRKDAKDGR